MWNNILFIVVVLEDLVHPHLDRLQLLEALLGTFMSLSYIVKSRDQVC